MTYYHVTWLSFMIRQSKISWYHWIDNQKKEQPEKPRKPATWQPANLDLGLDQLGLDCTREAKAQSSTSKAPTARPGCCPSCPGRARRSKTCLEGKGALRLFASNPQVRQTGASAGSAAYFPGRCLPAFCGELCAPRKSFNAL